MTDTATAAGRVDEEADDIAEGEIVAPDQPTTAALVPTSTPLPQIVEPAADLATVERVFQAYIALCDRLLVPSDYQKIGDRTFRKKSAWRKLAVAFNVSCEILERTYERSQQGRIVRAEVVARATHPNGRFMDGLGACDLFERCCPDPCPKRTWKHHTCCPADCTGTVHFSKPQHDIPATASTRAINRACSDLFGFGEVSAEEMEGNQPPDEANQPAGREAIRSLVERAKVLPKGAQDDMKTTWDRWDLPTKTEGEDKGKAAWNALTVGMVASVETILAQLEQQAKAGKWGPWEPGGDKPHGGEAVAVPETTTPVAGTRATSPTGVTGGEAEAASEAPTPPPQEQTAARWEAEARAEAAAERHYEEGSQARADVAAVGEPSDTRCHHPLPWKKQGNWVSCTQRGCLKRLYQGPLAKNEDERREALWRLAQHEADQMIARANARKAGRDPDLCMHPDPQAIDEVDGIRFWMCCGAPVR